MTDLSPAGATLTTSQDSPSGAEPPETLDAPGLPTTASLPNSVAPSVCANCGTLATDRFCPSCGQHQMRGRLTMRRLWGEFSSRVFNLNRGLLATIVGMSRRPGQVPLDYIEGRRRRYTNPLTYLFLASALSVFMLQFTEDVMRDQYRGQFERIEAQQAADAETVPHDHDGDGIRDHDPDEYERFAENLDELMADGGALYMERMMEAMKTYNQWLMALLCVPLVLVLRILFGPARHLPEIAVFSLYVVGHGVAVSAFVMPVLVRIGQMATLLGVFVYIGLAAWAAVRFWGEGWSAAARAAAAMIVAYVAYTGFVVAFVVVIIFGDALGDAGLTWGQFLGRMVEKLSG